MIYSNLEPIRSVLQSAKKDPIETDRVFQTIAKYIRYEGAGFIGILEIINEEQYIIRFKPTCDVADDCLFSCSFFRQYIENKLGKASYNLSMRTGKSAFYKLGYPNLSNHFQYWCQFLENHFVSYIEKDSRYLI